MNKVQTIDFELNVIVTRKVGRRFKLITADQETLEVDPDTRVVRTRNGGPPFVTLSVEKVPISDNSLTNRARSVMETIASDLVKSISAAGFGHDITTLDGVRTEVERRIGADGYLLTAFIALRDDNGLLASRPVEPVA